MNELEEYLLTNNTVFYEDNYFISYEELKLDSDIIYFSGISEKIIYIILGYPRIISNYRIYILK